MIITFFLSLEPPSCMVASIREIRNKFTSTSTTMIPTQNFILPTVYQDNNIGMDIPKEQSPDNYDDVRGRLLSFNPNISRNTSMFSMKSSVAYHKRIEQNNSMVINKDITNNDISFELLYKTT